MTMSDPLPKQPFELKLGSSYYDEPQRKRELLKKMIAAYNAATDKEDRYRLGTQAYMVAGSLKKGNHADQRD